MTTEEQAAQDKIEQEKNGKTTSAITQEQLDAAVAKSSEEANAKVANLTTQLAERDELLDSPEFMAKLVGDDKTKTDKTNDGKIDWNNISMEQAAGKIIESVSTLMDDKLKGISGETNKVKFAQQLEKANQDIKACQARHDDFDTYKNGMVELAKANPYLSAEQAYRLAKMDTLDVKLVKEKADLLSKPVNKVPNEPVELEGAAAAERAYKELQEKKAKELNSK